MTMLLKVIYAFHSNSTFDYDIFLEVQIYCRNKNSFSNLDMLQNTNKLRKY